MAFDNDHLRRTESKLDLPYMARSKASQKLVNEEQADFT